ncbi:hypothetical protein TgHK011_009075 [Trichoderma gracile]|nr:hypothetical protein TgHK011_009075 [Trichoderma gracile]
MRGEEGNKIRGETKVMAEVVERGSPARRQIRSGHSEVPCRWTGVAALASASATRGASVLHSGDLYSQPRFASETRPFRRGMGRDPKQYVVALAVQ